MKFYDVDNALHEAIEAANKPVRLKIEIYEHGHFEVIPEQNIIYANFYSLKEKAGGVSSRGEILINKVFSPDFNYRAREVRVSFSIGEGLTYFHRFTFYIDNKGCQTIRHKRKKFTYIGLVDLSFYLKKTDEARDWTSPAVFTYSVVCDKTQPEKSLVHCIAQRAGLEVTDIDCSTILINLPYVKLRKNVWAELSSMATAYRCHLECAVEKPLVFAHSPYQTSEQGAVSSEQLEDVSYTFSGEKIFYFRVNEGNDDFCNTVRLKINIPVSLEKQEIWRYDEQPVFYDEDLKPYYPFRSSAEREIEVTNYEAKYRVIDENGKERNVIFADEIDTQNEAEERIVSNDGNFSYSHYDITTNHDKAIVKMQKETDGDLYKASIHGRPIVLDLNRSCFIRDEESVEKNDTVALNVTGSYFSEDVIYEKNGIPIRHYEDWVMRELTRRVLYGREFTIKTHKAIFNARVGAKVKLEVRSEKLEVNNEPMSGTITSIAYRYKKDKAFVATFKIKESEV